MAWSYQYKIAGCVVDISSDSDACEHDMQKFLCLYKGVEGSRADLSFVVRNVGSGLSFVFISSEGDEEKLWVSDDAREITAALEIHLYSQLVQWLDKKNIVSIHSSVLNINDTALMFAGVSGAGKSSICTAGLLNDAAYLSDEFTLLDKDGFVHPFPRPMQWEHATHPAFDREAIEATGLIRADHFDFPAATGEEVRCHLWVPKHVQPENLPLRTVVLHQYKDDIEQVCLEKIARHEALSALPEHLHVQHGLATDLPKLNQRIPKDCQFYRLTFPDVHQAWATIKAAVVANI